MKTATVLLLLCLACATSVQGAAPRGATDFEVDIGTGIATDRLDEDIQLSTRRLLQQSARAAPVAPAPAPDSASASASAGRATGAFSGPSSTSGDAKMRASGDICYIASSTSATLNCTRQGTGTYVQQVPACCTSTANSSDNSCSTQDNAGSITCSNIRKYPACCEFRDQPASICTLSASASTTTNCGYQSPKPAIECCSPSGMCTFDNAVLGTRYGNYVPRTCPANTVGACCPA